MKYCSTVNCTSCFYWLCQYLFFTFVSNKTELSAWEWKWIKLLTFTFKSVTYVLLVLWPFNMYDIWVPWLSVYQEISRRYDGKALEIQNIFNAISISNTQFICKYINRRFISHSVLRPETNITKEKIKERKKKTKNKRCSCSLCAERKEWTPSKTKTTQSIAVKNRTPIKCKQKPFDKFWICKVSESKNYDNNSRNNNK